MKGGLMMLWKPIHLKANATVKPHKSAAMTQASVIRITVKNKSLLKHQEGFLHP